MSRILRRIAGAAGGGGDPLAPGALASIDLQAASDSGVSSTDNITSDTTPTFDVGKHADSQDGDIIAIYINTSPSFGGTPDDDTDAGTASGDPVSLTPGVLAEGTYYVSARAEREIESVWHYGPFLSALQFVVDTTGPTVDSVTITSSPAVGDTYGEGETISFTVAWDEATYVTGTPRVPFTVGASTKNANYASGSGTSSWVFSYTVQAGDEDTDGISVAANALELNSGTIKDAAGNNATITHSAIATASGHKVDAVDFEAEALAIFNAFTTPPDDTRKNLINDAIIALKASTAWAKLDYLQIYAAWLSAAA